MSFSVFPAPSTGAETYSVYAEQAGFFDTTKTATVNIPAGVYKALQSASVSSSSAIVNSVTRTGSSESIYKISSNLTSVPITLITSNNWTSRATISGSTGFNTVYFGNNRFVAAGFSTNQSYVSSDNGITWVTRSTTANNIRKGIFANSYYVSVGDAGTIVSSTDTVNWSVRSNNFGSNNVFCVAFGNGIFAAGGGNGTFATSTNSITWTDRTSDTGFNGTGTAIQSLAFGNGLFVFGTSTGVIRTSTDCISWTTRTSNVSSRINDIIFANGLFVAGTVGGAITTSTDGITWTTRNSNWGGGDIAALGYGGGYYIAVGQGNRVRMSTDAITWTTKTPTTASTDLTGVAFGNNVFLATGGDNLVRGLVDSGASTLGIEFTKLNAIEAV